MNIYLLDSEQPTTCPICGARTQFEDISHQIISIQHHTCLNESCKYEFIGEFEAEESLISTSSEEST